MFVQIVVGILIAVGIVAFSTRVARFSDRQLYVMLGSALTIILGAVVVGLMF